MKHTILVIPDCVLASLQQTGPHILDRASVAMTLDTDDRKVSVLKCRSDFGRRLHLGKAVEMLNNDLIALCNEAPFEAEKKRTYARIVGTVAAVLTVTAALLDRGQWYAMTPLPESSWEISVKEENKVLLDGMIDAYTRTLD